MISVIFLIKIYFQNLKFGTFVIFNATFNYENQVDWIQLKQKRAKCFLSCKIVIFTLIVICVFVPSSSHKLKYFSSGQQD